MNTMMVDPFSCMRLWTDMMRMGAEAQYVMTMRMAGLFGVMPQRKGENYRMVAEKGDAAREAMGAAFRSAASGARADEILAAAMKPYGRRTRVNARRLSRR